MEWQPGDARDALSHLERVGIKSEPRQQTRTRFLLKTFSGSGNSLRPFQAHLTATRGVWRGF